MSIPLDRLYHYVKKIIEEKHGDNVIIYRFFPHGSKKFTDLKPLKIEPPTWKEKKLHPHLFCNDQEPLNYQFYEDTPNDQLPNTEILNNIAKHGLIIPRKNFRTDTFTIWDCALLLHSERRSNQLDLYKNNDFLPVYYWSHAVIARDWFRYAEHIEQKKKSKKLFLVYARGWSGTREYRLKFLEMLANNNLKDHVTTSVQPVDPETSIHYQQHQYQNSQWKPNINLEEHYLINTATPEYSADFDLQDYENTEIEIVLETLFDDSRLHFTEKILRPIALGQPFILVGTHGGLEYLQNYGFKTFSDLWPEHYDTICDPKQRMQAIIDLLKYISQLNHNKRFEMLQRAKQIADYNKKRFFSNEFFQQVVQELESNISLAVSELKETNIGQTWYDIRNKFADNLEVQTELQKIRSQQETDDVYNVLLEYRQRNLNK
jgi:hypothetical protein